MNRRLEEPKDCDSRLVHRLHDLSKIEPASIDDFNKFSTKLGSVLEFISISKDNQAGEL